MKVRSLLSSGALAIALLPSVARATDAPLPEIPSAKRVPHTTVMHGQTLQDDWFWLREKESPEVRAYLESENAFSEAWMADTKDERDKLYKEMLSRIKETDLSVPWRLKGYLYYTRTEKGKQYPIWCRKPAKESAKEQVILDVNALAKGERFMQVAAFQPSPDGKLLAYSTDNTGFRDYVMHVRDLSTGKDLADRAERVTSVAWANDNKTLLYATTDPAKRSYRVWRHRLADAKEKDVLVYEEKDERFRLGVSRSKDDSFLVMEIGSHTAGETRLIPADRPDAEPRIVSAREDEHEYDVEPAGDKLYIRTNKGCRNFRVVTAPVSSPGQESWKELVPCRENVMVEGIDVFKRHSVLWEREDALPHVAVTNLATGALHRVSFPEAIYNVTPERNAEYDTNKVRFGFSSFTTPPSVYEYDLATRDRKLLKKQEVLGGYDPAAYVSERRYATAADGTRIPISVVYRKGTRLDGSAPMLLTAYGSYGAPSNASFSYSRPSLLDRGFVFGVAHIRGGGDLGKKWHDQGRMKSKMNTFTDFVACGEAVVDQKLTSKEKLVIEGGSAGGLLMGAVTNLRPDLFGAVISHVPFVDVINTMLDESLPLTVGEFEEWGNPKKKDEFESMLAYSPYDNLARKAYPPILVKTSFDDSQVMYWEPAKYVAKLRTLKTDVNPLIFSCNMAGGHGGSSGRYDRLKETAYDYAFVFKILGIDRPAPKVPVKL